MATKLVADKGVLVDDELKRRTGRAGKPTWRHLLTDNDVLWPRYGTQKTWNPIN